MNTKTYNIIALVSALLLMLMSAVQAQADTYTETKYGKTITWTYTTWTNNNITEARITGCDYTGTGYVSVPTKVNNLTVSSFGQSGSTAVFSAQCSIIMPSSLVDIQPNALQTSSMASLDFSSCTNLKKLPKSMCYNCGYLTSVTLPSNLDTIGVEAFKNDTLLESVEIPGSTMLIDTAAFYNCKTLTKLIFDNTTTSEAKLVIAYNAFGQCVKLGDGQDPYRKMVKFGTNVKVIGSHAFADSPFTYFPTLNEGLVEIGDMAFNKLVTGGGEKFTLPSTLKRIGNQPWGLSWNKTYHRYVTALTFNNESFTLPDGLEDIGSYSLMAWTAPVTSIKLPGIRQVMEPRQRQHGVVSGRPCRVYTIRYILLRPLLPRIHDLFRHGQRCQKLPENHRQQ